MIHHRRFLNATAVAAIASTSGLWLCGPADAQTTPSEATAPAGTPATDPDATSDIIVTATKRSESINRVPLSITAASGAELRSLGITDPADLTKIVSGFQAVQTQNGTPVYFLRGIGFDDISIAARPSVTLYADEAPLPYSVMTMGSALDVERVEVLKGPQGLLFGANSTGGAINFIAAKPTSTLSFGLNASLGRFFERNVEAFISGPIAEGLNGRLAVSHEGSNAWQYDYVSGDRIGAKDITSARLTLEGKADRLTVRLTASGTIDRSEPQLPQYVGLVLGPNTRPEILAYPLAPRNARATSFNPDTVPAGAFSRPLRKDNYQWQTILRADYDLSDTTTLTSLTNYARNRQDYGIDADGTRLRILDGTVIGRIRTFSQELRAAGTIQDALRWIVGGNFERSTTYEAATANINDSSTALAFTGPPFNLGLIDYVPVTMNTRFTSKAVFGNVDYDLGEKVTLHAGLRYTDTQTKDRSCSVIAGNRNSPTGIFLAFGVPLSFLDTARCFQLRQVNGSLIPGEFRDTLNEDNVSWRVGADYKPLPGTLLYASVSRGYKAGAYSTVPAASVDVLLPAKQEQSTAYELGLKSDVIGNIFHVNAAVFYYDYRDKQLQGTKVVPVFGPAQTLINVPKSSVKGAEVEVTLRPARGLTIGGSLSYVDTKVESSFVNPTRFGVNTDFEGQGFPNTPKWQGNANIEFRTPVSPTLNALVGSNVTYRSTTYRDFIEDDRLKIPSYALVDAQLGVEAADKSWLVQIYGRNIFDKYYSTNQIFAQETLFRYTGRPATYGVRASFRY